MLRSLGRPGWRSDTAGPAPFAVEVWWEDLQPGAGDDRALEGVLSPAELARAARFRVELDCHRFVAARAALRIILGSYLRVAPEVVTFDERPNHKPSVSGPGSDGRIGFSASRSEGLMVCAVASGGAVGIDVEALRPWTGPGSLRLSLDFLSPSERARLGSSGAPPLRDVLALWVAKEAALKLTGDGLAVQPDRVVVTLDGPRRPTYADVPPLGPAPYEDTADPEFRAAQARRVWLHMLGVAPGYVVGLAVPGADHRVSLCGRIT